MQTDNCRDNAIVPTAGFVLFRGSVFVKVGLTQWESCSFIKLLHLITLQNMFPKMFIDKGFISKVLPVNHSVFSGLLGAG